MGLFEEDRTLPLIKRGINYRSNGVYEDVHIIKDKNSGSREHDLVGGVHNDFILGYNGESGKHGGVVRGDMLRVQGSRES